MARAQLVVEHLHDAKKARARIGLLHIHPIVHGHIDHCLRVSTCVVPRLLLLLRRLLLSFFELLGMIYRYILLRSREARFK